MVPHCFLDVVSLTSDGTQNHPHSGEPMSLHVDASVVPVSETQAKLVQIVKITKFYQHEWGYVVKYMLNNLHEFTAIYTDLLPL